jgi:hypothetical protein
MRRGLTLLLIAVTPATAAEKPWVSLFDGRSIDNWVVKGGNATFKVENGVIVGTTGPAGGINTFLCTPRDYADFELELEVWTDKDMNSGVQIRSHVFAEPTPTPKNPGRVRIKGEVYGYQCEIADNDKCTSGNFWDEARWTKWHDDLTKKPGACGAFKSGTWNRFRIVAQGDRIRSWVNGVPCADFREGTDRSGFIGLQVHRTRTEGPRHQVRFRNIRIRELSPADPIP